MPCCHDNHNTVIELAMQGRAAFSWAGQKAMRSLRSRSLRSLDALHLSSNCERSELSGLFNARIFYIYIYIYTLAVIKNWSLHQNHDTVVKSMLSSPNMTILVFT